MKWLWIIFIMIFFISCGLHNIIPTPDGDENEYVVKILTQRGDYLMLKRIGEEFDVKVSVENATEVIGLNAWISYDPAIVEVVDTDDVTADTQVDAADLGFLSSAQLLVSIQKDGGVEQPGTLVCGYVSIPPTPQSGNGDCFSVRFRAIAQGTTNIDFVVDHVNLQDIDGDIPTDFVGDVVDVPVNATLRITVE